MSITARIAGRASPASNASSHMLKVLRQRRPSYSNRDRIPYARRQFWRTTACCWSPIESLPGRFSRSMRSIAGSLRKAGKLEPVLPKIIQQATLADMIGTTRSRVSFFMNKFRELGFLEYNGGVHVHSSLLNIVLHD